MRDAPAATSLPAKRFGAWCRSPPRSVARLGLRSRTVVAVPRLIEQAVNFFVGGLREVTIPAPDAKEGCGRFAADDLVDLGAERVARVRCRDRNGHDEPRRLLP